MKKSIAATAALVLGLSGAVGLGVASASAHNHTDAITCQTATVDLTDYDGTATVEITLDGVVVQATTPFGGQFHYTSPTFTFDAGHTSHTMVVEVESADAGFSFTHTDTTPDNCYTPPKNVPILPVVVHPATCDAGVTYDVPVQDADVKYALLSDGVTRPAPGTGFTLGDGQTITIVAHVTAAAVAGGDAPNDYSITIVGGDKIATIDCVPVPEVTHRTTDTNGETVCNSDGVGGGSYDETVTHYTTAGIWNSETESYDLVETIDDGYPVVTPHTVDASLEECPIHATTADPTVKPICSADDGITLATTANITYAIAASNKNGATVSATPADATVLDVTDGWTVQEDGSATFQVVYDNSTCPVFPPALALTGSTPWAAVYFGLAILAVGLTTTGIIWYRRREDRLEDEAIDQK